MAESKGDGSADFEPGNDVLSQSNSVPRPVALGLLGVLLLITGGLVWLLLGKAPQTIDGQGYLVPKRGFDAVFASTEGDVRWVTIKPGAEMRPDTVVALIRKPNGLTIKQRAGRSGTVTTVLVQPGETVAGVEPLVTFSPKNDPLTVLATLASEDAERVRPGMKALVSLPSIPSAQNGSIEGRVIESNAIPLTRERLLVLLAGNASLTDQILAGGPVSEVYISLDTDPDSPSGYQWTVGAGPATEIDLGTIAEVQIELANDRIVREIAR